MATQSQIDANRINAQFSKGPSTPEGKAKSSQNSFSHGFTASVIFIDDEDRDEYNLLVADLHKQFQPANADEEILLEKMITNHWLSLRAVRLQGTAMNRSANSRELPKELALLIRYQHASERGYYKARTELLKARKEREKSEIGFVSQTAAESAGATPESTPEASPTPLPEPPQLPDMSDLDLFEQKAEAALTGFPLERVKAKIAQLRASRQTA